WVDHAYTSGIVYLEQQFHQPTMSLDIFCEIVNEHKQRLITYGTPLAILQWDGCCKMTEEDHYHLMFKHEEEHYQLDYTPPKVRGLYYYIGMDPNWVDLWKQTLAHDVPPAKGPMTTPRTESEPSASMINIALGDEAMMMEPGKV
ncbi:hypothetical protein C0993_005363, partial [Termitomyces sp. T159_Od127]